ncbi:unnamed protein product [Cylicocyclus nassatus]|uniref:Uncharacterized protein n=1 Tax=Cylicocyclus nassatus TaxID=53992 RepID=A0AA36M9H1_CYLNA|nr:unnamed protein product [Cylicocyclus nassatus]
MAWSTCESQHAQPPSKSWKAITNGFAQVRQCARRSAPPDYRGINLVSARGTQPAQQLCRYFSERNGLDFRKWITRRGAWGILDQQKLYIYEHQRRLLHVLAGLSHLRVDANIATVSSVYGGIVLTIFDGKEYNNVDFMEELDMEMETQALVNLASARPREAVFQARKQHQQATHQETNEDIPPEED